MKIKVVSRKAGELDLIVLFVQHDEGYEQIEAERQANYVVSVSGLVGPSVNEGAQHGQYKSTTRSIRDGNRIQPSRRRLPERETGRRETRRSTRAPSFARYADIRSLFLIAACLEHVDNELVGLRDLLLVGITRQPSRKPIWIVGAVRIGLNGEFPIGPAVCRCKAVYMNVG